MLVQSGLQLGAPCRDPCLSLAAKTCDLGLGPRIDAFDVSVRDLAEFVGLRCGPRDEALDMRLPALLGHLRGPDVLGSNRELHRVGELREERCDVVLACVCVGPLDGIAGCAGQRVQTRV